MANTHGYCALTHGAAWDIDSFVRDAKATTDIDNGTLVVMGAIDNTAESINQYVFSVTPASAASTGVWLIRTPEVGTTLDMQMYNDPRHFYNEAGRVMTALHLVPGVDCVEFDANCFADPDSLPTAVNNLVPIGDDGKLGTPTNSAPQTGAYFKYLGTKNIDIGADLVPVYVLQLERN